jgi:hypothetical protein
VISHQREKYDSDYVVLGARTASEILDEVVECRIDFCSDYSTPFQAGIISAPDCGTMRLTAIFAPASACTT